MKIVGATGLGGLWALDGVLPSAYFRWHEPSPLDYGGSISSTGNAYSHIVGLTNF